LVYPGVSPPIGLATLSSYLDIAANSKSKLFQNFLPTAFSCFMFVSGYFYGERNVGTVHMTNISFYPSMFFQYHYYYYFGFSMKIRGKRGSLGFGTQKPSSSLVPLGDRVDSADHLRTGQSREPVSAAGDGGESGDG
jgi:hypothetical protein